MKKLINGVIEFRKNLLNDYRDKFSHLAEGQSPDTLLITCCDSRVVPSAFASTDPGDVFILRNIGNLVPPYKAVAQDNSDTSVEAAIEFSLFSLKISNIIVCGHSECGAMSAVLHKQLSSEYKALKTWLRYAEPTYEKFQQGHLDSHLEPHNELSQMNVIQQLEHLQTYPYVAERLAAGLLKIHGWWFDLATANMYYYESRAKKFIVIDAKEAEKM